MKTCIIMGAGHYFDEVIPLSAGDLVVAADGGFSALKRLGIHADAVIGDFDSLDSGTKFSPQSQVICLPKEKDETDMRAALDFGLDRGYTTFRIYGGSGGRFDHTMANVQCLAYLAGRGARGFLYGENHVVTCLRNGVLGFTDKCSGVVSVFAHSDTAVGVTLRGLKYELNSVTLTNTTPLGVSNEFIGRQSHICVVNGTLMLYIPHNSVDFIE